jgi:hypothetical protein
MQWTCLLLVVVLAGATWSAALAASINTEVARQIVAEASKIREATLAKKYDVVVDRMHPRVVEMMGGRAGAMKLTEDAAGRLEAQGVTITDYVIEEPTAMYQTPHDDIVFVPTRMTLDTPAATLRSTGFLVASRTRNGSTWVFIDGAGVKDRRLLELIFPGFPGDARIPERTQRHITK